MCAATTYSVSVDWPAIHAACKAVDAVRSNIGRGAVSDVFGGSYRGYSWEGRGLFGLVDLVRAESDMRREAWEQIHRSASYAKSSPADGALRARTACECMLALNEMRCALAATGLAAPAGRQIIGGTDGAHLAVVGLAWLVGMDRDDRLVPLQAVHDFVATGDLETLRVALEASAVDAAVYANA